jgi:regulator of cell morphogenesis and NO signaling
MARLFCYSKQRGSLKAHNLLINEEFKEIRLLRPTSNKRILCNSKESLRNRNDRSYNSIPSTSTTMKTKPIRDLVLQQGALAHVFERHGIDYCCNGAVTLEEACARKDIDVDALMFEIDSTEAARPYSFLHVSQWGIEFLIDYIVENHHRYCKSAIPVISTQLKSLIASDGEMYPFMKPVAMLFERTARELEQHIRKEEMILFPYIKTLASAAELGRRRPITPFLTLDGPLKKMEQEHLDSTHAFAKIRALLSDYVVPPDATAMYREAVRGMQAFIYDVHQQVHLENNLLFPKARDLERDFGEKMRD